MGKKKNGSILVLDDDFDYVQPPKDITNEARIQCLWVHGSFLALEHFEINHSTYSLVTTDLRMPVMSALGF